MKYILGLIAMLLPILSGAQLPPVKALSIGDTVPDITFQKVINYKDTIAKLSDFKGKLVIIDFWSSWCGPCVRSLPVLDSLKQCFGDQIKILLVTRDPLKRIDEFMKSQKIPANLPLFIETKKLLELFPHEYIPHLAWISKSGKVLALTGHKDFTQKNILMSLRNKNFLNQADQLK